MLLKLAVQCALVTMLIMVLVPHNTIYTSGSGKGTKKIGFVKNSSISYQEPPIYSRIPNTDSESEKTEDKLFKTENGFDSHVDSKPDAFAWKFGRLIGHLLTTLCILSFLGNICAILIIILRNGIAGWEDFFLFSLALVEILLFMWKFLYEFV